MRGMEAVKEQLRARGYVALRITKDGVAVRNLEEERRMRKAKETKERLTKLHKEKKAEKAVEAEVKEPKAPKAPKAPKEKRMSGLDAVAQVLKEAGEPLDIKTITERAIAKGWKTNGKTPAATIYAAIIREIGAKGDKARFVKTDKGMFTLTMGQVA